MHRVNFFLFTVFFYSITSGFNPCHSSDLIPKLETYVVASQVETLFSTPQLRAETLKVYQDVGIRKVYLEGLRSGIIPSLELLRTARDFLVENNIEVSTGITLTHGKDFGQATNNSSLWLNYQHPKTQSDVRDLIKSIAPLFDELMIDDFLATDDESEISREAKGNQSWSEYRLKLMTEFAKEYIIKPAREVNPDITIIEKFPQWYDRFHKFGYNIIDGPQIFERIWVGTETRNPDTKRFGYVVPTEGYINFSWIKSIVKQKIGGGWFDFGDCAPLPYLMQAYQSVLAGAQELVLFESGSVVNLNPCMEPFLERREALFALGEILDSRVPRGMHAYKPPNSNGSDANGAANLYIFDYLATLGLAPLPVAQVPDHAKCVFLARQAADDPGIKQKLNKWLTEGIKVIATPDFLSAAGIPFDKPEEDSVISIVKHSKGTLCMLNLQTFRHEEFSPGKEMFLPPRPLPVTQWKEDKVNLIRKEILPLWGINLKAPNNIAVYLYDDDLVVLANFNNQSVKCEIQNILDDGKAFKLHPQFPHKKETSIKSNGRKATVTVSPWELTVLLKQ
jgi:hypothetical protein